MYRTAPARGRSAQECGRRVPLVQYNDIIGGDELHAPRQTRGSWKRVQNADARRGARQRILLLLSPSPALQYCVPHAPRAPLHACPHVPTNRAPLIPVAPQNAAGSVARHTPLPMSSATSAQILTHSTRRCLGRALPTPPLRSPLFDTLSRSPPPQHHHIRRPSRASPRALPTPCDRRFRAAPVHTHVYRTASAPRAAIGRHRRHPPHFARAPVRESARRQRPPPAARAHVAARAPPAVAPVPDVGDPALHARAHRVEHRLVGFARRRPPRPRELRAPAPWHPVVSRELGAGPLSGPEALGPAPL